MSYPSNVFTDGSQLDSIITQVVDIIVANTGYSESDAEIVALRDVAEAVNTVLNDFVDLDTYPPTVPNRKALREAIVLALSGSTVTNGPETTLP